MEKMAEVRKVGRPTSKRLVVFGGEERIRIGETFWLNPEPLQVGTILSLENGALIEVVECREVGKQSVVRALKRLNAEWPGH